MNIDSQRIAAVKAMEGIGYTFTDTEWKAPASPRQQLQLCLTKPMRCTHFSSCTLTSSRVAEGLEEEADLKMISETLEAYEVKRWPNGKVPGGKG